MAASPREPRVWIDLTNSPHVLFFRPIIRRLDEAGVETAVTARDFAQTLGLLELYGIPPTLRVLRERFLADAANAEACKDVDFEILRSVDQVFE